jgi:hypothetical protein
MATQPISNQQYNLVSVVYHAAQGAETTRKYLSDAKQSGDQQSVKFLEEVCRQYEDIAQRGMQQIKSA